jgi:hypothetical protein
MEPSKFTPHYVLNKKGRKTAVILPIKEYDALLEDLKDLATIAERRDEPTVPHSKVIATLALFFVALALMSGCADFATHFRRYHDEKSLLTVLQKSIKPGFTINQVQKLLGQGVDMPTQLILATKKDMERNPKAYLDGFRDTDIFLAYPTNNAKDFYFLQFRDNHLINFYPEAYTHIRRDKDQ